MNLFSLLDQAAHRFPDRGAVWLGTEQLHTYAQLRSRALRFAGALRMRCGTGDRVAIASENRPEYVELLFAIWAAGMVAVPVNAKLHPKEMIQILDDATASMAFVSPRLAAGLAAESGTSTRGALDAIILGEAAYAALLSTDPIEPVATTSDMLAWLFYTSGTTGRSKGAMLTHRNLVALTLTHLADTESFDENASQIHAAPMSHGSGLYIPAYVARAARQVIPASAGFDPAEFIALCDRHPGCGAFLAPTMVQRLRLAAEDSGRRPAHLRTIIYGGGPMYMEELKKSIAVFGQVFVQIYGQGEAPMTITSLRREDHAAADDTVLGSVGWPHIGIELAIVNAEGVALPTGEVGEIVCRGDVVMAGYWNNPKATADALRGGWLYTGDMGSLDARGYLTLRDRSKDVIISGGSNIYPREVEEALLSCPGVQEVCVVGQPDEEWGEVVVAFVVVADGVSVSKDALDAHCLERIARFKRPKHYIFIDTLPKNNYGKVLKRTLRESLPQWDKQ